MSTNANGQPRSASDLCDWVADHRDELISCVNLQSDGGRATRDRWSRIARDLDAVSIDDGETLDLFRDFLTTLTDIPGTGDWLPSGFRHYPFPGGRAPVRAQVQAIHGCFRDTIQALVTNERVTADDGEPEAVPPTTVRRPSRPAPDASGPEARS